MNLKFKIKGRNQKYNPQNFTLQVDILATSVSDSVMAFRKPFHFQKIRFIYAHFLACGVKKYSLVYPDVPDFILYQSRQTIYHKATTKYMIVSPWSVKCHTIIVVMLDQDHT